MSQIVVILKKRWPVMAGIFVVLIIAAIMLTRWLQPESVLSYQIVREDVVATLTVTGEVRADRFANVGSPVSARIVNILVDDGDVVRKGQILAELDQDDVQARLRQAQAGLQYVVQGTRQEELARWEAVVSESQSQLAQSEAALRAAQSARGEAERNESRFAQLYRDEVISAQEYDAAVTKRDMARQDVERLQADVNATKNRITQNRKQLEQARRGPTQAEIEQARAGVGVEAAAVGDRYVRSNLDGVVLSRVAEPGEIAQLGSPIVKIADRSTLEIIAFVEEVDLPRVKVGDTAHIVLDALPEKALNGVITRIGSEVNPANGTVEVKIKLTEKLPEGLKLLPGMTTDVNIVTEKLKQAVVVPVSAIGKEKGQFFVYKLSGRKFVQQPVKVARISLEYFQITDDSVKPGDWVARFANLDLLGKRNVSPQKTALESKDPVKQ